MLCTHRLVTVPVESRNPMNGDTGVNEGINGRESRNIRKEWKNRKERGGFGDSWYCCLLEITVS